MDALSALIEVLNAKKDITDLESDILETFKEYSQNPFERKFAEARMEQNYTKYSDIFAKSSGNTRRDPSAIFGFVGSRDRQ